MVGTGDNHYGLRVPPPLIFDFFLYFLILIYRASFMFGSVLSFQEGKLNMSFAFLDDEA